MPRFAPLLVLCCSTVLLFFASLGSARGQTERFEYRTYRSAAGDSLQYRLLRPIGGGERAYPLVIFLHGSGERGSDNAAQLKWGVQNFATDEAMKNYPAYVIAPQCAEGQRWAEPHFEETGLSLAEAPTEPMLLLRGLIEEWLASGQVAADRVYITGLSLGGMGTFYALAHYPELFAAGMPVCGIGSPADAATLAEIPIWIFTGAEDDSVNPQNSQGMFQALVAAGARPGFTQYPEVNHFSWIPAYSDPMVMAWLFRQRKEE